MDESVFDTRRLTAARCAEGGVAGGRTVAIFLAEIPLVGYDDVGHGVLREEAAMLSGMYRPPALTERNWMVVLFQGSIWLPGRLHHYNWHRPHASLGYLPPVSRLKSMNNNEQPGGVTQLGNSQAVWFVVTGTGKHAALKRWEAGEKLPAAAVRGRLATLLWMDRAALV